MHLFIDQIPEADQHPNYRRITGVHDLRAALDVIQQWSEGFVDRDGKFVKEFQTTFNSSFWELYLFACFKELGFTCSFEHASPDFYITRGGLSVCVEAGIASNPEGYAPEWDRDIRKSPTTEKQVQELLDLTTLRLANTVSGKHRKYLSHYSALEHVKGRPFVLCVAPFDQPYTFGQNDHAIRRVLYGYDQPLWLDDPEEGIRIILGDSHIRSARKKSGAEVPFAYFTGPGMKEISAVLFSCTATFGKARALAEPTEIPAHFTAVRFAENGTRAHCIEAVSGQYEESLLDGLHLCLNPFASVPLDCSPFEGREITIHRYFPETDEYLQDPPDGFLFYRSVISVRFVDEPDDSLPASPTGIEYHEHERTPWPEGVLQPIGGQALTFADNSMAHYKGWTVVVSHDTVDGDWGCGAKRGVYFSMPEFITGEDVRSEDEELLGGFHASMEDALAEMLRRIDEHKT